jgi:hypothetical protein
MPDLVSGILVCKGDQMWMAGQALAVTTNDLGGASLPWEAAASLPREGSANAFTISAWLAMVLRWVPEVGASARALPSLVLCERATGSCPNGTTRSGSLWLSAATLIHSTIRLHAAIQATIASADWAEVFEMTGFDFGFEPEDRIVYAPLLLTACCTWLIIWIEVGGDLQKKDPDHGFAGRRQDHAGQAAGAPAQCGAFQRRRRARQCQPGSRLLGI